MENTIVEKRGVKLITTCLDEDLYYKCKRMGWKWTELMKAGIGAKENPNNLLERINVMQSQIEALIRARNRIPQQIREKFAQ